MVAKPLSSELVSLINYVELNKSGWWKKATSQIILGYLWESLDNLNEHELHSRIKSDLNIDIPIENISTQIEYLLSKGLILKKEKKYLLTESTRKELNKKRQSSVEEDSLVENLFKELMINNLPNSDADGYWHDFKNELSASIRRIGANTYTFLKSGRLFKTHDWLSGFLNKYPDSEHQILLKVISEFLNANNEPAKSYILRLLNAYFFVEASQLNKETIKSLEATRKSKDLKIVLDTNFVFSILGLHENPADESATSLLSLADKVGNFNVRYYILPTTLEEIRKVVSYQLDSLKRHRYSPHLARAAIVSGMRSSIAAKYFAESAKSDNGVSPDAYFLPFTDGLLQNLESKGIKILEWHTIHYPTDERVVHDQLNLWEKEEKKPEQKRKRYEAIEHDLIFWYSILDHRDGRADSALEETYWGVTIDWSMIQFDQAKRRIQSNKLPVVLHPTNLVQLLQFWVPRDETLESGIMEAIKLPLFFGDFDANDERATIDLIQALSTYKNIDSINVDILSSMLGDKALKQKILDADSQNDKIIEIIESEFAHLANGYKSEIDTLEVTHEQEKQHLYDQINQLSAKVENLEKTASNISQNNITPVPSNIHQKNKQQTNKERTEAKTIHDLKLKIKVLEEEKSTIIQKRKESRGKGLFLLFFILIPLVILSLYFHYLHSEIVKLLHLKTTLNIVLTVLACYLIVIISTKISMIYISSRDYLKKWWLVKIISSVGSAFFTPIVIALITFKDELIAIADSIQ
ncbi:hypothetical protein MML63_21350 [Kosakonia sacchari]|uniref:hypothetical protein n=1 Tax=Kosakonia sacchari TaxID=1158459 RepID=UPI0025B21160|nr:hypothetical protein [Kosakonia sacchari]MDN2488178.1 hypothetical protein [Kosakonia sacchari]